MHLAQVLQMALHEYKNNTKTMLPEKKYIDKMKLKDPDKNKRNILMVCAAVGAFIMVWALKKK
jgi:hypothetical protein